MAARREAERHLEPGRPMRWPPKGSQRLSRSSRVGFGSLRSAQAAARQAVAKAQEEALSAKASAVAAEERVALLLEGQQQLEARLCEKEAQLAPLRRQLAQAAQAAKERQVLSSGLQEQLSLVVSTSEERLRSCAEAKARLVRKEQETNRAQQEVEGLTRRVAELEEEQKGLNEALELARKDYEELQKAYDEAGGALCERFGEAGRMLYHLSLFCLQHHIVGQLQAQIMVDESPQATDVVLLHGLQGHSAGQPQQGGGGQPAWRPLRP